jgi:hypothetical protein
MFLKRLPGAVSIQNQEIAMANRPELSGKPDDKIIDDVSRRLLGYKMIRDASDYVKKHISRQPPVQRFFSFMPTMLTRVSPFHLGGRIKPDNWPLVRLDSGEANSWGRMRVIGELLVIFDETVLFSILALMSRNRSDAFATSLDDIGRLTNVSGSPTVRRSIWQSIQRLAGTRIDLELTSGRGRKKKSHKELVGSILSFADLNREDGSLQIIVNPYFLELYAESFVTNIDLQFRAGLKSDLSKAFYRYYQGQYQSESEIEMLRLARAVNLETGQDPAKLRTKIRKGLRELEEKGYFEHVQIDKDLRVCTRKSADTAVRQETQILAL